MLIYHIYVIASSTYRKEIHKYMNNFKNDIIPPNLKTVLSSPALDAAINQQAMIQQIISPPVMNSLMVQQNIIAEQSAALRSAFSVSEMVSKSLTPSISIIASETARALQASLPRFDYLKESLTEVIQSLQVNIPKVDYLADIAAITNSFQNMTEAIIPMAEQVSKITQSFTDSFRFQISELVKTIPPFDISYFSKLSETFAHIKNFEEKNDLLKKYGWLFVPELPEEIADKIYEQRDEITQEEVDSLIIQHFRNNRCAVLKQVVNGWRGLSYFESRKNVFHEALVCHSRRMFNSATTMLSLHFEGIVTDFIREKMSSPTYRVDKALKSVTNLALEMPMNAMPFTDWIICRCVLEGIDQVYTTNFSPADPESCPNSSRHKIAHGHATEKETEANSLRRFLYMNEMYKLFSCLESELQVVA